MAGRRAPAGGGHAGCAARGGFFSLEAGDTAPYVPIFQDYLLRARQGSTWAMVALWGGATGISLPKDVKIIRIEDGFLRSRGLGAELVQPYSWCIDPDGIHFDPTRPSRLEKILEEVAIPPDLAARAARLRRQILAAGLSKYNLPGKTWTRPPGRRVVLVAGQVEDDASILKGSPVIRRNIDLLKAARLCEPDAWLVYKPHPDVVSGLRVADENPRGIAALADEILPDVSLGCLLGEIDALHVMTSQIGFEGLLRKISVTCHGLPFYAGWGLTKDFLEHPRRTKTHTIDALVAAA